ncbi:MAG: FlgO family outer membrane protein [Desulfobulbaceae bacterium]|nr:FlgO family outer membrane protein [Desulfobulbaceae bacterium]
MRNNNRIGMLVRLAVLALALGALAGCATVKSGGTASIKTPDFFGIADDLAVQLKLNSKYTLSSNRRLLLTTVVNIDDFYQTSRFGRTLTDALAGRLFRNGFGIVEIRKASHLMVREGSGELMLTRDTTLMAAEQNIEAVVVGTYSLTPNSVIVSLRMIEPDTRQVLSVADMEIQRSGNINHLLYSNTATGEGELSAYER